MHVYFYSQVWWMCKPTYMFFKASGIRSQNNGCIVCAQLLPEIYLFVPFKQAKHVHQSSNKLVKEYDPGSNCVESSFRAL